MKRMRPPRSWVSDNLVFQGPLLFPRLSGMSSGLLEGMRAYTCAHGDSGIMWYHNSSKETNQICRQDPGTGGGQNTKGERLPTEHGDGHHVPRAWGWKAGSGEERMKMRIFLKVHGMEVVGCGARRDTLSHTWASDQSWKVQRICRNHEPLFKPPLSQTSGPSRLSLPSSQEPR